MSNGRAEVKEVEKPTTLESPLKEDKDDLFSGRLARVN
jgi:hypothetical protein